MMPYGVRTFLQRIPQGGTHQRSSAIGEQLRIIWNPRNWEVRAGLTEKIGCSVTLLSYSEFSPLNSNWRIVYATCSWNQSARFHSLDQDRRRAEADQVERQFRKEEHAPAFFPDGIHRDVHG